MQPAKTAFLQLKACMATTACVSAGVMTSAEGGRDAEM